MAGVTDVLGMPRRYATPTGDPCPRTVRRDGTIEGSGNCMGCATCLQFGGLVDVPGLEVVSPRKQVVLRYFEGFRRSDHAEVLACLTDDVVWDRPGFERLAGKAAFRAGIENEALVGSAAAADVDRLVEEGDTVVAIGEGTHRGDARCDVFTFRGGLVSRIESYAVPLG
jgi:ketosteroid isomerase-like protein